MSTANEVHKKQIVTIGMDIAEAMARLAEYIDPTTAEVFRENFDGEGGDLWKDALGNLQLRRVWDIDGPRLGFDERVLIEFQAMAVKGKKSILAHNDQDDGLICELETFLKHFEDSSQLEWRHVRLSTYFDMETGRLEKRNAFGLGRDLWRDGIGNMQVRLRGKVRSSDMFTANFGTDAISKFLQTHCERSRSVLVTGISKDGDFLMPISKPTDLAPGAYGRGFVVRGRRILH